MPVPPTWPDSRPRLTIRPKPWRARHWARLAQPWAMPKRLTATIWSHLGRSVWDAGHAAVPATWSRAVRTSLGPGASASASTAARSVTSELDRRQARAARLDRRDVGAEDRKGPPQGAAVSAGPGRPEAGDRPRNGAHLLSCAGAIADKGRAWGASPEGGRSSAGGGHGVAAARDLVIIGRPGVRDDACPNPPPPSQQTRHASGAALRGSGPGLSRPAADAGHRCRAAQQGPRLRDTAPAQVLRMLGDGR